MLRTPVSNLHGAQFLPVGQIFFCVFFPVFRQTAGYCIWAGLYLGTPCSCFQELLEGALAFLGDL